MPLSPPSTGIFTDSASQLDLSRLEQKLSGYELTAPADPNLVGCILHFASHVDTVVAYARRGEPCEVSLVQAFATMMSQVSVGSESRALIDVEAPLIPSIIEEILSFAYGQRLAQLRGTGNLAGCPGRVSYGFCGVLEPFEQYTTTPDPSAYGTCGQKVCRINKVSTHMVHRTQHRLRQNSCFFRSDLPYCQAISCEDAAPSFVRCRVCAAVIHKGCLDEFFDVGNYAFVRGDASHLICTDCFLPFPELFMVYLSARKPQEDVAYLVVLPFHVTLATHQAYCRLLETYSEFVGPALAFMGDYDELADGDFISTTNSATPITLAPEQRHLVDMRTQLLGTLSRTRSRADGLTGGSRGDSEADSEIVFSQGSPVRAELLAQLSAVRSGSLPVPPSVPAPLALTAPVHVAPAVSAELPRDASTKYVPPAFRTSGISLPLTSSPPIPSGLGESTVVPVARVEPLPELGDMRIAAERESALGRFGSSGIHAQPGHVTAPSIPLISVTAAAIPTPSATLVSAPLASAPGGNAPTFEELMHATVTTHGLGDLVSGAIDGLTLRDPASPSYPGREMLENYSGNSTDAASKRQMQRLMQSDTLGASSELQYTPLQERGGDLVQEGASLRVKDKLQFPRADRFLNWCRRRCEDWERIRSSGLGVFAHSSDPDSAFKSHYRTAVLIVSRYEFMMELVDYVRSEMPNVPFDATYVLITSYYVTARWTKQPFSRALKEDRDLVRMGSEPYTTVSARRENLRRLVMETFPTMAFQRVMVRLGLLGNLAAPGAGLFPVPPQPSEQLPRSPVTPEVPSEASRPCPLCGSAEHSYYAGHYTHTGPITRACNRVKRVDGVKKKCVKKHAFSGPLMSPCEYTGDY